MSTIQRPVAALACLGTLSVAGPAYASFNSPLCDSDDWVCDGLAVAVLGVAIGSWWLPIGAAALYLAIGLPGNAPGTKAKTHAAHAAICAALVPLALPVVSIIASGLGHATSSAEVGWGFGMISYPAIAIGLPILLRRRARQTG